MDACHAMHQPDPPVPVLLRHQISINKPPGEGNPIAITVSEDRISDKVDLHARFISPKCQTRLALLSEATTVGLVV